MKNLILSLILFSFVQYSSYAQAPQPGKLEHSIDSLLSSQVKLSGPGVSVLVAKKGQVIYKKAFGQANIELNVPLQTDMVFKIASVTKQFTAIAILQLIEQGKISLQDSLQKFVPDFPAKGYKITIENLLTHTSGIRDYLQIDYPEPYMERRDFAPKQLIDSFKNFSLEFEPGTKFRYSNSGYFLLGYIIEKVSGQSYYAYLQKNILTPLGLSNSYFDTSDIIIPGRVTGYGKEGQGYRNADYWSMTIAYAAGGLFSNTDNLFKWQKGLLSYKILKKETLEKAFMPFKLKTGIMTEYGYGWFIKNVNGIQSIEHDGAISGFLAKEIYFPAEDLFIAVLFNCDCFAKDELSVIISSLALGKPMQQQLQVNENVLNTYLGTYALMPDLKRKIEIIKEKDHLVAKVAGQGNYELIFQSDTKFELKNILSAKCEFIKENGKVTKFLIRQNGEYEWKKIE